MKNKNAFTLIEMLVVIAIIGIVASMVVGMNGLAQRKKRDAQVKGDLNKLVLAIDNYHSHLNFYPPDNPAVDINTGALYDAYAATNPLLYELTGATNNYQSVGNIRTFDNDTNMPSQTFSNVVGRIGVNNAFTGDASPQNFLGAGLSSQEYTYYTLNNALTPVEGLLVPVPISTGPSTNFWHYDSSSTNRHNMQSYDLWAEYISGTANGSNVITVQGNW